MGAAVKIVIRTSNSIHLISLDLHSASSSAQSEGDRKWHQDIFDQTVNVISKLPPAVNISLF